MKKSLSVFAAVVAAMCVTLAIGAGLNSLKIQDIILTADGGGGVTFANGTRQTSAVTPADIRDASVAHSATATTATTMAAWDGGYFSPNDDAGTFLNGQLKWAIPPTVTPGGASSNVQFNSSGAFSGSSNFIYVSPLLTLTNAGIGITPQNTFYLLNSSAATVGVPVQYSPSMYFRGSAWDVDGAISDPWDWRLTVKPVSANDTTSTFVIGSSKNGAAFSEMMSLGSDSTITAQTFSAAKSITAASYSNGVSLTAADAATAGNQRYSPSLMLQGNGWKTDATAASQAVAWRVTTVPVQGAAAPSGNLVFESSIAGGGYSERAKLGSTGQFTAGMLSSQYVSMTAGGYAPSGTQSAVSASGSNGSGYTLNLVGTVSDAATAVPVAIGNVNAITTEGGTTAVFYPSIVSGAKKVASIDKDGAYYNAYGSGQTVHGSVNTLAKTLVTTADDDSAYMVKYYCVGNEQATTPRYWAMYEGNAMYKRVDGTLTQLADTSQAAYENDADCACTLSASANAIIVTFNECVSSGAGSGTMNWKIWATVYKVGGAAYTGVTYPAAN